MALGIARGRVADSGAVAMFLVSNTNSRTAQRTPQSGERS